VHEYFPREYFKHIGLIVIIAIVLRLLVYLIKRIVSPKKDWILKQYQEAYDKGLCLTCGKPIRIGPLRYAVGGKPSIEALYWQGRGGRPLSSNFIPVRPAENSSTKNAVNAVTLAIRSCLSANIGEMKKRTGHNK